MVKIFFDADNQTAANPANRAWNIRHHQFFLWRINILHLATHEMIFIEKKRIAQTVSVKTSFLYV